MKRAIWLILLCSFAGVASGGLPAWAAETRWSSPGLYTPEGEPVLISAKLDEKYMDDDLGFLDEEGEREIQVADPLYDFNLVMFKFNDWFYLHILEPVAKGYREVMPEPARTGVRNFFHNLTTPIRFVNCVLQWKGEEAGNEFNRFLFNTTVGVLGFMDLAKKWGDINPADEDLGQTLGVWGLGNGFYIVWPFLGPSTGRDTVGKIGDSFLNPISYVEPTLLAVGIKSYEVVNRTSFRIGDYQKLKDAALDPYDAIRDAYIQYREREVKE